MNVKEWTTVELIEFLNSYNRVLKADYDRAVKLQPLYVEVFAELSVRQPYMALLY